MNSARIAILVAVLAALTFVSAPGANAQPYSDVDRQFVRALLHGGICCDGPDSPIWENESPELAINTGKMVARAMAERPTYDQFQMMRGVVASQAQNRGKQNLDGFESGQFVVIAVRYYAGPAVECSLIKEMGGAVGEAPYWYGKVTYKGGLVAAPNCDLGR